MGAEIAQEGEGNAEVLFAEAADRDAGRARIVAEQEDGLTDDRAASGVAFFGGSPDAGRAGGGKARLLSTPDTPDEPKRCSIRWRCERQTNRI